MKFKPSIVMFVFLLSPSLLFAFSISGFFGFKSTTTDAGENFTNNQETLQTLKVFEPKKIYRENKNLALERVGVDILNKDQNSFETNKDFTDALDENSIDNHSENALYTVKKGDSIYSIADYFGVSVETIMTFNHMPKITVRVGDVLEVPSTSGVLYKVKKGDTLSKVAKVYNIDADNISLFNGLFEGDTLVDGDEIFLPGAKELESAKPKKTTKTLASKNIKFPRGDTSHLNTSTDIKKYSSLPKYPGYYLFPAPGAVRTQKMHGHNGADFAGKVGTQILASADGVVRVAKTGGYNFGYGNYIIISHSNGTETIYGHLSVVNVSVGQAVSKGQEIAKMGSTGNSTGSHLHFEIRGAYNPFAW